MKPIGDEFDLTGAALLPIGDNFTMGAKDAAIAATVCGKAKKVVGMHYDTFDIIEIDHDDARDAFRDKGVELLLPQVGETFNF